MALLSTTLFVAATAFDPFNPPNLNGMMEILHNFQAAAENNSNSRSIANGYNDSAEYVYSRLEEFTDVFTLTRQYFTVPVWTEVQPPTLSIIGANPDFTLQRCTTSTGWQHYEPVCDYRGVRYGGHSNVPVEVVNYVTQVTSPCTIGGFFGFPAGQIALITVTSACEYMDMITNAQAANASAVLLATTSGSPPGGRVMDSATWVSGTVLPTIPTIGISVGIRDLILQTATRYAVRITSNQRITLHHTYNVFATTLAGNSGSVLMLGAHLDSVPAGPGINDNGSGSAMVLQLALQLAQSLREMAEGELDAFQVLRFAWWGAEEIGLMGSRFYVNELAQHYPEELDRIEAYLNFDMEAGPNFVRMVYDGRTSPNQVARPGSEQISGYFSRAFGLIGLAHEYTPLTGGSDFLPFILAGIPCGGLATGASGIKSEQEQIQYHGLANTPLDPCYHAPCDTVEMVNQTCLTECGFALAEVLATMTRLQPATSRDIAARRELNAKVIAENFKMHARGFAMSCDGNDESEGHGHDHVQEL